MYKTEIQHTYSGLGGMVQKLGQFSHRLENIPSTPYNAHTLQAIAAVEKARDSLNKAMVSLLLAEDTRQERKAA